MRFIVYKRIFVVFSLLVFTTLVQAQEEQEAQIVTDTELNEAISERSNSEEADRAAIQSVLRRTDVREIAERYGLNLTKAQAGVTMLNGTELSRLAYQARQIDQKVAGGDFVDVADNIYTIIAIVILVIAIIYLLAGKAWGL